MCCSFDGFDFLEWLCSNGNKKPISDLPDRSIQKSSSEKIQEGKVEQEKQKATTDVSGSKASKRTKSLKKKIQPFQTKFNSQR